MVVVDFADSECEASAKSVTVCAKREQYRENEWAQGWKSDIFYKSLWTAGLHGEQERDIMEQQ